MPTPFEIEGVRPDIWGVDRHGHLAIGEAKTVEDIDNGHTRRQLRAYRGLRGRTTGRTCRVYIAVPRSGVLCLDKVLIDVQMIRSRDVVRMHVPDCLLEGAA
jgi:hypothetical protein